jgi:ATP phosphoribosyltransferase
MSLTLALPRGRLFGEVADLLRRAGLPSPFPEEQGLVQERDGLRYLLLKPADVAVYVREGAAALGVTGKDVLLEEEGGYGELLDLGIGACRLSVCGRMSPAEWQDLLRSRARELRVATRHPRATASFFAARGLRPRIIILGGSLELAPLLGLAEVIVDLVATGRTLDRHGLRELEVISPVTARLIANPVFLRLEPERAEALLSAFREARCVA